ncbi:UNVERIFIED_CONTAM: hypothetical protein K2H54_001425 [Gekko kuhli]
MVYFSAEEMGMLEPWQRELYFEVLKDNYESLVVIGNPVTSADVIAWFKQGERPNGPERQGSRAGGSSATDGRQGQIYPKLYTETLEAPKVVDGRSEEEKAQYGNVGGAPEDSCVPFVHQGSPRRDEGMPHPEKAAGGLAGPAQSQDTAMAPKPYKCQECGARFRLKGLLGVHQVASLRKPSHPCPVCGIRFPSWRHLRRHQRIHRGACQDCRGPDCLDVCPGGTQTEERSHFCADCGESFRWYLSFLQHQKSHEEEDVCLCAQCNAVFMYRSDLAIHEESHFGEALCVSSACEENCVCRFSLLLHFASRLEKSAEKGGTDLQEEEKLHWEDGGLGQIYSRVYTETLEAPKIVDGRSEEEKAQYGNVGGAPEDSRVPFVHQGSPRRDECMPRLEKATGGLAGPAHPQDAAMAPKPYKCQECGARFRLKGLLGVHQVASLRKPSHPCPVCDICFPSWRHLRRHQRIHGGACPDGGGPDCLDVCPGGTRAEERSHFCADCGESFRWYLSFLQHQKSHEEKEDWPCAQCRATFMYRSDLAMHEESHFDEALCVSSACGEHCVCRFSLLLHLASQLEKSRGTASLEEERVHWEGNPATRSDLIAKRGEGRNGPERQASRAGGSSASGGLGQTQFERYTETLEAPKIVDGRTEEEKAQYGNVGGAPEDLRVPFVRQGSPLRDECMPHLEKVTGGLAGPAQFQYAAVPPTLYECRERCNRVQLEGQIGVQRMASLRKPSRPCPVGGIHYPSWWHLRRHQRIHGGACPDSGGPDCPDVCAEGRSHFCAACGESFRWYLSFLQHQKSHEEEKVWPCVQCKATFMYRSELAMHEESHFNEAMCVSSACGEHCVCRFSLPLHFASQLEKSAGDGGTDSPEDGRRHWEGKIKQKKPFSCHRCGGQFRLEENLEKHYRYCYQEPPQKHRHRLAPPGHQKECDKQVRERSAPKRSRKRSSPPSETPSARWACAHCKKSFTSRYSLFKHRQTHKAEERRSAAERNKSTRPASGLGDRPPVGITKKLHKCQECGKRFVFKRQLVAHMKAHGEGLGHKDHVGKRLRTRSGERAPRRRRQEDSGVPSLSAEPGGQGEKDLCQCADCGKSLTKAYFPDHQAWHSGGEGGLFHLPHMWDEKKSVQELFLLDRESLPRAGASAASLQSGRGESAPEGLVCKTAPPPASDERHITLGAKAGILGGSEKSGPRQRTPISYRQSLPKPFGRVASRKFTYEACLMIQASSHSSAPTVPRVSATRATLMYARKYTLECMREGGARHVGMREGMQMGLATEDWREMPRKTFPVPEVAACEAKDENFGKNILQSLHG